MIVQISENLGRQLLFGKRVIGCKLEDRAVDRAVVGWILSPNFKTNQTYQ